MILVHTTDLIQSLVPPHYVCKGYVFTLNDLNTRSSQNKIFKQEHPLTNLLWFFISKEFLNAFFFIKLVKSAFSTMKILTEKPGFDIKEYIMKYPHNK